LSKTICVVTATRAEYDGLYPLLKKIKERSFLKLDLVVTGAHLCQEFGNTYKKILDDGFEIKEKIDMLLASDSASAISKSMAVELFGFADYFSKNKPDLLVILGDRYELLPVCFSALNEMIPIAHISGGEITKGAIDDNIRHAITKFSYLHFVANDEYRRRVIQLGENPNRVFAFGELSLENVLNEKLLSKNDLEKCINFKLDKPYVLITFHPETISKKSVENQISELINALKCLNLKIIFTKANADKGGRVVNKAICNFVNENPKNRIFFDNLGRKYYLSAMKYCDMIIGNSSSGIYESPSFFIPNINIGARQEGRVRAFNTVDCDLSSAEILKAIHKVMCVDFKNKIKTLKNPYEGKNTSEKIVEVIIEFLLNGKLDVKKEFYDF
jgi:GDP/UDP-N,N'-diacetylbacillosamine 2-epimerase (hydrolysing)